MPITPTNPFKGRQFPGEVIILCVRWYLRYPLAYERLDHLDAVRKRFQIITDRFAGFQAQCLNVHVDFPLLQRLALPVTIGAVRYPGIKSRTPASFAYWKCCSTVATRWAAGPPSRFTRLCWLPFSFPPAPTG